jgi:hypothetical protein
MFMECNDNQYLYIKRTNPISIVEIDFSEGMSFVSGNPSSPIFYDRDNHPHYGALNTSVHQTLRCNYYG